VVTLESIAILHRWIDVNWGACVVAVRSLHGRHGRVDLVREAVRRQERRHFGIVLRSKDRRVPGEHIETSVEVVAHHGIVVEPVGVVRAQHDHPVRRREWGSIAGGEKDLFKITAYV